LCTSLLTRREETVNVVHIPPNTREETVNVVHIPPATQRGDCQRCAHLPLHPREETVNVVHILPPSLPEGCIMGEYPSLLASLRGVYNGVNLPL